METHQARAHRYVTDRSGTQKTCWCCGNILAGYLGGCDRIRGCFGENREHGFSDCDTFESDREMTALQQACEGCTQVSLLMASSIWVFDKIAGLESHTNHSQRFLARAGVS